MSPIGSRCVDATVRVVLASCLTALFASSLSFRAAAQEVGTSEAALAESAYYALDDVEIPDGIALEVGGMAFLPTGELAVATRRGEVWIVEHPGGWGAARPHFRLFARGLHEPLGLAVRDGALYAAQRGELTRLDDEDGDGRADRFTTLYDWPVSGNYHEYSFGPLFRENGNMLVTLNLSTVGPMASLAKWRGWMLEIGPDGDMTPMAAGMRSPAGFAAIRSGDVFYAENQGDWIGSGWLTHVERGDFVGHPASLAWASEPGSPLQLEPEDIPDTGEPMFEVAKRIPELKPPAVWFPHGIMGISTSGLLEDTTDGAFGPFAGQLFVGDQGHSKIMRVALEKVDGVYQGVVFPFREGFASGVLRMAWDREGTMYVGMTSRGWDATGPSPYGLQRLRWTGRMPFEARTVRAAPDGFEIEFTVPADETSVGRPDSFQITSFTYKYHSTYGSPVVDQQEHAIAGLRVSDDGRKVRIAVDDLRQGYIYEIKMPGVRTSDGRALLHDTGYFTLNAVPSGAPLEIVHTPGVVRADTGSAADAAIDESAVDEHEADERERRPTDRNDGPKHVTEQPEAWSRPDVQITVGTRPGLQYDLDSFEVEAGARVQILFRNDDDMLHNLVVVRPGTADRVATEAISMGLEGAEKGYVPDSDDVLHHTSLLQPGTNESIFFTAPEAPGTYTFVCTFPGHAATMRGVMIVRE